MSTLSDRRRDQSGDSRQEQIAAVMESFRTAFKAEPRVVTCAPGRVNLIGEHTDYNDGFVLPVAIDRYVAAAAGPRDDGRMTIYSQNFSSLVQAPIDRLRPSKDNTWSNYVKGVAFFLRKRGHSIPGANLAVAGNIPEGAGLSSSAALEIAVCYALAALCNITMNDIEKIKLCRQAENDFVGVSCGIMDQFISALARKNHALFLDCRSLAFQHTPFPAGAALLVCHTGVNRNLASSQYNLRRQECLFGVKVFSSLEPSVKALRDVSVDLFEKHSSLLNTTVRKRCRHVVTEIARTRRSVEALNRGDLSEFGKLMYDSHLSLKNDYEVSSNELDAVVDICAEAEGVYGARMTGAGFGGSAICLVREGCAGAVAARLQEEYPRKTSKTPLILQCVVEDGVAVYNV